MPIVTLNLRDLRTGKRLLAEFETLDSCLTWLRARPQFLDVLGPTDENLTAEADKLLRSALREFDDEERALIESQRQEHEQQLEAAEREARERQAAEQASQDARLAALGPNDEMKVSWERGAEVVNAEPRDTRAVPEVVRQAVAEWVAERDSWVSSRGQRVSGAFVTVWPGEVPAGQDRVHQGGQFDVALIEE